MSPLLHHHRYQQLLTQLLALQTLLREESGAKPALQATLQTVKQAYQSEILPLPTPALEPEALSRWQSVQTELNRIFHLLQTDAAFLQAARQPQAAQQRRDRFQQRLEQAIAGCEAAIALTAPA